MLVGLDEKATVVGVELVVGGEGEVYVHGRVDPLFAYQPLKKLGLNMLFFPQKPLIGGHVERVAPAGGRGLEGGDFGQGERVLGEGVHGAFVKRLPLLAGVEKEVSLLAVVVKNDEHLLDAFARLERKAVFMPLTHGRAIKKGVFPK